MTFVMTNYRVSESLLNPGPQGTVDHTAQYGHAAQVRPSTRAPTATETIPESPSAAIWKPCWKPHSSRPHPGATGAEYNRPSHVMMALIREVTIKDSLPIIFNS
ncbi:hypothetical protein R6Z07F_003298 [Ovis aries]